MENLLKAIATKISGSALSSDVGGRIYHDEYPPDEMPPTYPYVIYFDVTDNPDNVFAKTGEEYLFQFSMFSNSSGSTEITNIRKDLRALFDDCDMTIPPTGTVTDKLIWCKRGPAQTFTEEVTTDKKSTIKHWTQEYFITTQKA
jgi:hypothetical protein